MRLTVVVSVEIEVARRHLCFYFGILFLGFAHFRCLEDYVAHGAPLLILLALALEPLHDAFWVEEVPAVWYSLHLLPLLESLHTYHTVLLIKFIAPSTILLFFNLIQEVFERLILLPLQLRLQHRPNNLPLLSDPLSLRLQLPQNGPHPPRPLRIVIPLKLLERAITVILRLCRPSSLSLGSSSHGCLAVNLYVSIVELEDAGAARTRLSAMDFVGRGWGRTQAPAATG